ncbi:hypothetical protein ROHU_005804 [Labeo rohita]|uniref:Uncharacterized protein n=1 Tax=Labeo rohita TaxID=84645 RepID=A0A498NA41_LABRO|nr:hypothetical protein ROHU_005804 [Labeo rohita]
MLFDRFGEAANIVLSVHRVRQSTDGVGSDSLGVFGKLTDRGRQRSVLSSLQSISAGSDLAVSSDFGTDVIGGLSDIHSDVFKLNIAVYVTAAWVKQVDLASAIVLSPALRGGGDGPQLQEILTPAVTFHPEVISTEEMITAPTAAKASDLQPHVHLIQEAPEDFAILGFLGQI